ncbi:hypothetical protein NDU88_003929 [Pleurodeles waltl]|uniref:Uncharacterized protein n=1 Tax=Pleurodeles waltl TaxID=8319 RepID=A0AAV7N007_PLEWA|nr:hypothetical protein NDU88_003929 [Pleurodeles waltl]
MATASHACPCKAREREETPEQTQQPEPEAESKKVQQRTKPRAGLAEKQTHQREVRPDAALGSLPESWSRPPGGTLDNRRVKAKGVIINSGGSTLKDPNSKRL